MQEICFSFSLWKCVILLGMVAHVCSICYLGNRSGELQFVDNPGKMLWRLHLKKQGRHFGAPVIPATSHA
jgi:hypothetical protein